MAQFSIPLAAVPSQVLTVRLGEQSVRVAVYQKRTGTYCDVSVDDVPVVSGRAVLDRVALTDRGMTGELYMVDTQGRQSPSYEGLGARWQLVWDDGAAAAG